MVLDLRYEARDIDQKLTSQAKIDQWFDAKTQGLTNLAKAQLKKRWGTMRKVLSSRERLEKIAADIQLDMATRDRLMNDRGNAMVVCDSIHSACRLYEMFRETDLADKVRGRHLVRAHLDQHQGRANRRRAHRTTPAIQRVSKDARRALRRAGRHGDAQGRTL